ncbi:hypothetical protein ZIOFF_004541 [Zingiber officinale]|uniref:Uncharacterized protein n=1 Tax=Zingiber officinale TaxID=94328 RepID=A0A8J5HQ39_ZINOF|nr:hypothetical protein ZIOFF_004541 [Zingiber officinale]
MPLENQDLNVPQVLLVEGIVDKTEANEAAERNRKPMMLEKQYHDELNMELRGITYSSLANVNLDNIVDNGNEDCYLCGRTQRPFTGYNVTTKEK